MTKANINISLALEGLNDLSDQQNVEGILNQYAGIIQYNVDVEHNTLQLEIDSKSTLKQLATAISQAGYTFKIQKKSFAVLKMTCASCAASINAVLQNHIAIISANVNFASSKLSVIYYSDLINDNQIREVVQSVGFDLIVEQGVAQHESFEKLQAQKLS